MFRVLVLAVLMGASVSHAADPPTKVHVNGVELHYIEQGSGEPMVLLHGGQGDYRAWAPQMKEFSTRYRVIAYSRRFNYPNENPLDSGYRSTFTDADDLDALIRHLKLERVRLVGTSAGALTALALALKSPARLHSLVLAEPPIHHWAKVDPLGAPLYKQFMTVLWEPAAAAFKAGDDREAMKILVDGFGGTGRFDRMPEEARIAAMQNARFFKVATTSADPFPDLPKRDVERLEVPVLIVTGANTLPIHKFVNGELERLLPKAERVTIANAGHASPRENPEAFNEAVLKFLGGNALLRRELLQMRDVDQAARMARDFTAVRAADEKHTARLKAIVAERGWPTISQVGEDGANAAWLLAQHADRDPEFQRQVLALMEPLVAKREAQGSQFAYLYDRTHKPQRFGTQGKCEGPGKWVPLEIEAPDEVDARRAAAGIYPPKLADYAALVGERSCK